MDDSTRALAAPVTDGLGEAAYLGHMRGTAADGVAADGLMRTMRTMRSTGWNGALVTHCAS